MKQNAIIAVAVVAVLVIAGAAVVLTMDNGKGGDSEWDPSKDFAGYTIKPVENFDNGIVAIGQDAFRWMTYFGVADKCVMVDLNDKTNYMGKAFMYVGKGQALEANSDLQYGVGNCMIQPADVRTILDLKPSLVVVPAEFENNYPNEMKSLRESGLNVFHLAYLYNFLENGSFETIDVFDRQIDALGTVLGKEDRASDLKNVINSTVQDILSIRENVTEKRTGYIGAVAYNGAHGVDSSIAYYLPFELAGITNILSEDAIGADKSSHVGTYSATYIKENMKDDTILFIDGTGAYTCTTNTDKGIMELFKGHEAYIACPYIWTGINYENVLVGAYQILHDVYGLLSDEEFKAKANAVYEGFLGTSESLRSESAGGIGVVEGGISVYDDMNHMYEERRGNPIHGAISVSEDGIVYL